MVGGTGISGVDRGRGIHDRRASEYPHRCNTIPRRTRCISPVKSYCCCVYRPFKQLIICPSKTMGCTELRQIALSGLDPSACLSGESYRFNKKKNLGSLSGDWLVPILDVPKAVSITPDDMIACPSNACSQARRPIKRAWRNCSQVCAVSATRTNTQMR